MNLDLPFGPWSKYVSGQWDKFPLTIYRNPDKVLLLVLFEKQGDEVKGLMVMMRRALVVEGDLSKFIVSQKREMTLVEKFSKDFVSRFLLVGSSPAYINYSQDSLVRAVRVQFKELDALTRIAKEVVSSYDVKARDLKDASEEEAQLLLGDPFTLLSFGSVAQGTDKRGIPSASSRARKVQLGIDRLKQSVDSRLESMGSALVVGETVQKRLHVLHVLAENALLNNVPCMIFDSRGAFSGLALPNKDASKFEMFKMAAIPLGFPFKAYELDKGLFVDISLISSDLFLQTFSLDQSEIASLIKKAYDETKDKMTSLGDLVIEINDMREDKNFSRYQINKAVRVVEVIQKSYPSLFAKNLSTDLTMPFQSNVGKTIYVNMYNQPQHIQHLIIQSLLQPLTVSKTPQLSLFLVFETDAAGLPRDVLDTLHKLSTSGFGFALQTSSEDDVKIDAALKIELVGEEAVSSERGEKQKRFVLRPAYSHCSEYK
ncbi:MAG: hypothetical protein ACE5DI_04210 [Candidatus Micrarchaeia archaeon]